VQRREQGQQPQRGFGAGSLPCDAKHTPPNVCFALRPFPAAVPARPARSTQLERGLCPGPPRGPRPAGGPADACSLFQAYMEDHLKNKNRLEKEWEALCAYQAEPSSSLVAQREENLPKNRCPAVLTCTYRPAPGGGGGPAVLSCTHRPLWGRRGGAAPAPLQGLL